MEPETTEQKCAKCGKPMATNWFARVHQGNTWAVFCSPACFLSNTNFDQMAPWNDAQFMQNAATFPSVAAV